MAKQTPFTDNRDEIILVGDYIIGSERNDKPMQVCFGEYTSRQDDWGIEPKQYGYYITYHDGGLASLTQRGGGYSIAAGNCKIVKRKK